MRKIVKEALGNEKAGLPCAPPIVNVILSLHTHSRTHRRDHRVAPPPRRKMPGKTLLKMSGLDPAFIQVPTHRARAAPDLRHTLPPPATLSWDT